MNLREKTERLIRKLRVPQCEIPFIVYFRERSGSTYLCSLLDSHPEVCCRQEDFHEFKASSSDLSCPPLIKDGQQESWIRRIGHFGDSTTEMPTSSQVVAHLHDIFSVPRRASGFKFKYSIQPRLFPEVFEELQNIQAEIKVIALIRNNVLKQAISRQKMMWVRQQTNSLKANFDRSKKFKKALDEPFELDVEATINYARYSARENHEFRKDVNRLKKVGNFKVHSINYENLNRDPNSILRHAFSFLGVHEDSATRTCFAKATSDDLTKAISNYSELHAAVQGTELQTMLFD